jgi:hypothetical protein
MLICSLINPKVNTAIIVLTIATALGLAFLEFLALPSQAGLQRPRRFFATNLHGFSRVVSANSCGFVKSVAEILGFPVKKG